MSDNVEVSVTFVNDEEMRSLNKEYRGVDSSTDVLSFAFNEGECPAEELCIEDVTGLDLLGDIVISVERAILQAKEYNHGVDREVGFLTVHGMLHLLGFDHNDEEERTRMREMEEKILRLVGLTRDKSV